MRLVARALAGGDHVEAAGARPVDVLANERGLVAPGEAIDHARGLRLARKQGTGERIRLNVDHHDVLAVPDGAQGVTYAGGRDAGRLDDHFDLGASDQRFRVLRHVRGAARERVPQRGCGNRLIVPPGGAKLAPRAGDVEIGHRNEMHAVRQAHLGDKHGAELARSDQADGDRTERSLPFEQHGVEVHGTLRANSMQSLLQTNRELSSEFAAVRRA
jgi:hypothetical protein